MFAWLKRWRGHKVRSISLLAHPNLSHRYREQWRDCCDCIHDKEISSDRCRRCFDDPAQPDWAAKWANVSDQRAALADTLNRLVRTPDLQDLTCVRMAQRDMASGDIVSALARMRVDADKIRPTCQELYDILNIMGHLRPDSGRDVK